MVFLKRVVIENFKSIAYCDVELGPLTYLVGPNGAGKTNFLQALRFVSAGLQYSLNEVIKGNGGFSSLLYSPYGLYESFQTPQTNRMLGIRLEFAFPSGQTGHYAFRLKSNITPTADFQVHDEELVLSPSPNLPNQLEIFFRAHKGKIIQTNLEPLLQWTPPQFTSWTPILPQTSLCLTGLSGFEPFGQVYPALTQINLYYFDNLFEIRQIQQLTNSYPLSLNGDNLASIINFLANEYPQVKERIENYLKAVVPSVHGIKVIPSSTLFPGTSVTHGFHEALLVFEQIPPNGQATQKSAFAASAMSDGTLRILGILTALFQTGPTPVNVICIEEPELYLHPAAAAVLREAMEEASLTKQVIVTCHSPDILDDHTVDPNSILAVISDKGASQIGHISKAGMTVLKDHLFTPGELLRMDQLTPTIAVPDTRTNLFDLGVEA